MSYYPNIPEDAVKNLVVALKLAAEQSDYLTNQECPYGHVVGNFIQSKLGSAPAPPPTKGAVSASEVLDLEVELIQTYNNMKDEKPSKEDAASLQGFYRTRTSLLTKMVELQERVKNQKSIGEFYSVVLNILEEIATPTQRTIFAEKLGAFLNE